MRARPSVLALAAVLLPRAALAEPVPPTRGDLDIMLLPFAPGSGELSMSFSMVGAVADAHGDRAQKLGRNLSKTATTLTALGASAAAIVAFGLPNLTLDPAAPLPRYAWLGAAGAISFDAALIAAAALLARTESVRALVVFGPMGAGVMLTTRF